MIRAPRLPPLAPGVIQPLACESRKRIGELLHANSVQAGLRRKDGVRYRPRTHSIAREVSSTAQLRATLRLALREFLILAERHPLARELPLQEWHSLAGASELWTQPALSAEWAAQLLPQVFEVQLTHTVNQLRLGLAKPALHDFHHSLSKLAPGRETQSAVLRNSAAAYELLGDPEAAYWCAQRSFQFAPWCETGLLSFLVYSLLTQSSSDILQDVERVSQAYCGSASREQLWTLFQGMPTPALERLQQEPDLALRFQDSLLLRD